MINKVENIFNYSRYLADKPPIGILDENFTKKCIECGADFETRCRIKERCSACQSRRSAAMLKRSNDKRRAKRIAERGAHS